MASSNNGDITGALCVFCNNSPFSDFAPISFTIDGIAYFSVEHYFQIQMVRSFGLFKLAIKLSTMSDAGLFRRTLRVNLKTLISNGVFDERVFNAWRITNAYQILKKANRAKLEQNFDLKKYLMETGDRILVFTNPYERLFGIGLDEMIFLDWIRQQQWRIEDLLDYFATKNASDDGILGKNILGYALMDIRAEIACQPSVLSLWKKVNREKELDPIGNGISVTEEEHSSTAASGACDNNASDDHILANLSNVEAPIITENADQPVSSIWTSSTSAIISNMIDNDVGRTASQFLETQTEDHDSTLASKDLDRRKLVLERLKPLQFEKPMINPFSASFSMIPNEAEALSNATNQIGERKIPRLFDLSFQLPLYGPGYVITYPNLEPGEVPSQDYGLVKIPLQPALQQPIPVPAPTTTNRSSQSDQPMTTADAYLNMPANDDGELWKPSSNPMKDVFQSAKAGIKKLIETAKNGQVHNDDLSRLLLLRPPPIQAQPEAKKRKATKRKAAPSYAGIFFNSKDAQMRHLSNRWVKGGRLTTTGKFEECHSDDEEDSESRAAKEVDRTLRQLEATPAYLDGHIEQRPSKPVQIHIVYEDTSEYADYAKWYADVHGCTPSDVVDDEYQQYLRQWYRWYKTAVKFVDIEPLTDDQDDTDGTQASEAEMNAEDKSKQLIQQWRWQQINEWELKTKKRPADQAVLQETHSDGVSFSGKPIAYGNQKDNQ